MNLSVVSAISAGAFLQIMYKIIMIFLFLTGSVLLSALLPADPDMKWI